MNALMSPALSRRHWLKLQASAAGLMFISTAWPLAAQSQALPVATTRPLEPNEVDGFLAIHPNGDVSVYCGKVDLGTGLRIAIPQMVAEELGIGVQRIQFVEGDTGLTPDQGPTAGSTGIMRGGVQIRQAAATAREALTALAAQRLGRPATELDTQDGAVVVRAGGTAIGFAELMGGQRFSLKLNPKAPLRDPATYTVVGKPLPRPDVPAKVTGRHVYMHDFKLPGMLHARVIRPTHVGAKLLSVDVASIRGLGDARVVRLQDFLAVVATDEWDAERAARALKAQWSTETQLMGHEQVRENLRSGPFQSVESLMKRGDPAAQMIGPGPVLRAEYYWPVQSHASMGPSCSVADLKDGQLTVWSASQGTHRLRNILVRVLNLPKEKVRVVYLDGAGCYGMNGHDDASADAALISRAVGQPVRVQWTRQDEHRWDPKGPPQLIAIEGRLGPEGQIAAWRTQLFIPKATASLPNVPLLGPESAGISQPMGLITGLLNQNGNPPYAAAHVDVVAHWLKDAPLRPSNIRAPGKIANCFAVESFTDELAHAAGRDPVQFRLKGMTDPRGIEVIQRCAALLGWQERPSPAPATSGALRTGRGMAYMHYKNSETYVALAIEVEVNRSTGDVKVKRMACAHDCGLVVNVDGTKAQIEGNLLQTLSRTLHEEVLFDRSQVKSSDWVSYPIMTFAEVPELLIDIVNRPTEPPLGAGEAAATPVPAALANAIFDATGVRLRSVPMTRERVAQALKKTML